MADAIKLNEHHWATRNRPVSSDTIRQHLHISSSQARELTKAIRAKDRATLGRHNRSTDTEMA